MKPFEDIIDSSESSFSKELFVEAFKYFNQEHGSVSLPMMVGILIDLYSQVEATVATAPVTEADSISISNVTTETLSKRRPKKSARKGKKRNR